MAQVEHDVIDAEVITSILGSLPSLLDKLYTFVTHVCHTGD
jgi:hypothetical protein